MEKRIEWVDNAKGYGTIFVIFSHAYQGLLVSWLFPHLLPLFFFLSGYTFNSKISFTQLLKRRIKSLLVPYLFLGLIVVLSYAFQFKQLNLDSLLNLLIGFLFQQRFLTIWFIPCLFILNIIAYCLIKISDNEYFLIVVSLLSLIVGDYYYRNINAVLYWNIDICLMALPYFLTGYIIRKKDIINKYLYRLNQPIVFMVSIVIYTLTWYLNYRLGYEMDMFSGIYGNIIYNTINCFSGILCTIIISINTKNNFIKSIGRNSIVYYILHQYTVFPLVQSVFDAIKLETLLNFTSSYLPLIISILKTAVTILITTVFNKLLHKLNLGFIIGR